MRIKIDIATKLAGWLLPMTLVGLPACAPIAEEDGGVTCGDGFFATQDDFKDFQQWTSFDAGDATTDNIPVDGNRVIYINQVPDGGSKAFPCGTIIVKTANGWNTPDAGPTFAMVKHGLPFNTPVGGWEWYDLIPQANGEPEIQWHGVAPPPGQTYSTSPITCDECHAGAIDNDYVPSPQLSLSHF